MATAPTIGITSTGTDPKETTLEDLESAIQSGFEQTYSDMNALDGSLGAKTDLTAFQQSLNTSPSRAEFKGAFTSVMTGQGTPLTAGVVAPSGPFGQALRITGADVGGAIAVARIEATAVETGRIYRARFAFRRATDPASFAGHDVVIRIQTLDSDRDAIDSTVIETISDLAAADGQQSIEFTFSRSAGADHQCDVNTRYVRPNIYILGADHQLDIASITIEDVTDTIGKVDAGSLSTVATTGSYNDLSGKPTLSAVAGSGNSDHLTEGGTNLLLKVAERQQLTNLPTNLAAKADQTSLDAEAAARSAADALKVDTATYVDTADAAGIHARALAASVLLGYRDPAQMSDLGATGGYLAFADSDFLLAGVTKAALADLSEVTFSRTGTALALNAAGIYETFTADVPRVTDRGLLIEGAVTNLGDGIDFSGWASAGGTVAKTDSQTPALDDGGVFTGTLLTTATVSAFGIQITGRSVAAGTYTFSYVVEPIAHELSFQIAGGGLGTAIQVRLTTGGEMSVFTGSPEDYGVEELANGRFRVWFVATLTADTFNTTVRAAGSAPGSGIDVMELFFEQIEAGSRMTSPALASRGAEALTIEWQAAGLDGDMILIDHANGTSSLTRADLAASPIIDLLSDGDGDWLGVPITRILLIPAQADAYRTIDQAIVDNTVGQNAGAVSGLLSVVARLMSSSALGRVIADLPSEVLPEPLAATDKGLPPYLVARGDVYYWHGRRYTSEAAMLAAMGGGRDGGTVTVGGYVSDLDLLGGVDFTSDVGGFVAQGDAAIALFAGELQITINTAVDTVSRNLKGLAGRALRWSADMRVGTATNVGLHVGIANEDSGTGEYSAVTTSATPVRLSVDGTPVLGNGFYFGARGAANGNSYMDNPTLKEVWPCEGFPNGAWTLYLEGTAPDPLPDSTQVLFEVDTGGTKFRSRLELRSGGALWAVRDYNYGLGAPENREEIQIGTMVAGEAFRAAFGVGHTELRGAMDGAGAETEILGAVGGSYMRIGRSYTGEAFGGTIDGYALYAGVEGLGWMNRVTAPDGVSIPWFDRNTMKLVINGDSYSVAGTTGVAPYLADLGWDVVPIGAGGTSLAQQAAVSVSRPDLDHLTQVWYDGSPNDHVDNATAQVLIAAWVTQLGHDRWLYVHSGQIPDGASLTYHDDMVELAQWVRVTYGARHVYDPQPAIAALAIIDADDPGYADDQADIAAGYFPRSVVDAEDGIHLPAFAKRVLARNMDAAIRGVAERV